MRAARRTTIVLLGLVAAVTVLFAVKGRLPFPLDHAPEPAVIGGPASERASEAAAAAQTPEEGAENKESAEPARRIVQVPDTRTATTDSGPVDFEDVSGANIADLAARSAEKALENDLDSARDLTALLTICRHLVPREEETLEEEIQRTTEMAATNASLGSPFPAEGSSYTSMWFGSAPVEVRIFPTEAQNREHLTEWYRGCRKVHDLFDEKLREELEALARSGHVTARYLYAMWRPEIHVGSDALEHRMRWQINAFEFSYANLQEGEVAGLLAFSQSYVDALFTGIDLGLSIAMAKAALECGYDSAQVRRDVERFGDEGALLRRWTGITSDDLEVLVTALAERCR